MRWLVTGANGFLGGHACRYLAEQGHSVVAAVREPKAGDKWVQIASDLTVSNSGRRLIESAAPEVVLHCAALTNVDACQRNPELARRLNADLCGELAETCGSKTRLVMISTDQLWRAAAPMIPEQLPPDPAGVYGATKAEGERLSALAPRHLVLRTNFFGKGPAHRPSLSDTVLTTLRAGKSFNGFCDVFYTPIEVTLLVRRIVDAVSADLQGLFHLAGSERLSKYDFAIRLARKSGLNPDLVRISSVAAAHLASPRPSEMSLDCSKFEAALDCALPSIDESLVSCLTES
jgi:dTDP-4-dehydrorhamnose reductase